MSFKHSRIPQALLLFATIWLALACGSTGTETARTQAPLSNADLATRLTDESFEDYKKAIASAAADGYVPVWLGREFDASGATFTGPSVDDSAPITGGGVSFAYGAGDAPNGSPSSMRLTQYSAAAWEALGRNRPTESGRPVQVGRYAGTLTITSAASGNQPAIDLIVRVERSFLIAHVQAVYRVNAPDLNPLMNEATFLSVMQHLRPYPQ